MLNSCRSRRKKRIALPTQVKRRRACSTPAGVAEKNAKALPFRPRKADRAQLLPESQKKTPKGYATIYLLTLLCSTLPGGVMCSTPAGVAEKNA